MGSGTSTSELPLFGSTGEIPIDFGPAVRGLLAAFQEPRSLHEAAVIAGLSRRRAYAGLRVLRRQREVVRCGRNAYLQVPKVLDESGLSGGGAPMAAKVLACLWAAPRNATELSEALQTQAESVRRVIYHLIRQGLVQRIGYGVYQAGPTLPPDSAAAPIVRPAPIADRIYELLSRPTRPVELRPLLDRPIPTITGHLHAMMLSGRVRRLRPGLYARVDWADGDEHEDVADHHRGGSADA